MQAAELGMRLLSSASGVPLNELMRGYVPDQMDAIVAREAEKMAGTRLLIDDNPQPTITGVRSMLRRLSRRVELGVVVIDYLQLMQGSGSRRESNREAEVAEMSRAVKLMKVSTP
jgi:replicative DNA helicase